ncbi:hypothetical protein DVK05_07750 [Halorubrum sp. Atlit-8R]|uniref:DUF5518 domain-containing protein n=1 Tax=unclassified Halorubrum TaxID=2642239 RepID=UPI000EF23012|nr:MULTISPECIES: DUF5518 domain-containing protein [unclassified Halorubrum]RLM63246.1 hypothetical protein DVK08_17810 [Halorubrum sp. Atlit-9R]RLM81939.1 hypothetical protein DVK05_07750 [Halorubrum sp. Atlit-8R]
MDTQNTYVNALVGAVATALLSFTGISPLLGGAVAGYLEGGDARDGLRVGAISGAIASIPAFGILIVVLFLIPVAPDPGVVIGGGLIALALVALVFGYVVTFSAVGGLVGAYAKREL